MVPVRGAVLRAASVSLQCGHGGAARLARAALPRSALCVCRGASPAQCGCAAEANRRLLAQEGVSPLVNLTGGMAAFRAMEVR